MTAATLCILFHLVLQGASAADGVPRKASVAADAGSPKRPSQRKRVEPPVQVQEVVAQSKDSFQLQEVWSTGGEGISKLEVFLRTLREAKSHDEEAEPKAGGVPIPAPPPPLPRPVPAPPPDRKVCDPCPEPPAPEVHLVPPSRPHYPCPGNHEHYFEYHQSPPPDCICRLVKRGPRCL